MTVPSLAPELGRGHSHESAQQAAATGSLDLIVVAVVTVCVLGEGAEHAGESELGAVELTAA